MLARGVAPAPPSAPPPPHPMLPPLDRPNRLLSPPSAAHVSVCESVWDRPPRYEPSDQIPCCQSAPRSGPIHMAPTAAKNGWGRHTSGRVHAP